MTQTHIRKQKHQLTLADATHAIDVGFATVTYSWASINYF